MCSSGSGEGELVRNGEFRDPTRLAGGWRLVANGRVNRVGVYPSDPPSESLPTPKPVKRKFLIYSETEDTGKKAEMHSKGDIGTAHKELDKGRPIR